MGGLGVGDGFKFGCGFILAAIVAYLVIMAIVAMVMFVMAFLGLLGGLAALQPHTMLFLLPLA